MTSDDAARPNILCVDCRAGKCKCRCDYCQGYHAGYYANLEMLREIGIYLRGEEQLWGLTDAGRAIRELIAKTIASPADKSESGK